MLVLALALLGSKQTINGVDVISIPLSGRNLIINHFHNLNKVGFIVVTSENINALYWETMWFNNIQLMLFYQTITALS